MGGFPGWCAPAGALFSVFVLAGCGTPDVHDLARNERLFPRSKFVVKLPVDRAAFVAPLVDARKSWVADANAGGYPVTAMPEGIWARPLPEMLDEVLREELASSGVVREVLPRAEASALIVKPSIVTGAAAVQELPQGRRTIAEGSMRIVVLGPDDGTGKRATLLDETYGNRQASDVEMRPAPALGLLARAFRVTVSQILAGLDQANVARAGVPLTTPEKDK